MAVIIAQHHFSITKFCGNRIRQGFTGEVAHHQQFVFVIPADVGEHLFVVRVQQRKVTMANDRCGFAQVNEPPIIMEHGIRVRQRLLCIDCVIIGVQR